MRELECWRNWVQLETLLEFRRLEEEIAKLDSDTWNWRLKVGNLPPCSYFGLVLAWVRGLLKFRAKLWLKLLNWELDHACMCISWNLELFSWKLLHACPYYCYNPWIHHVFGSLDSIERALKLWIWLSTCMLHLSLVLDVYLEIVFNWTTFGFWFLKLIFETCHIMGLKCFFRKWA